MPIIFTYRSFDKNKNNNTPSDRRAKKASLLLLLASLLITLVITIITTTPSIAVHKGAGDLSCGGCHTMHSSQGGASGSSMGTATGSFILLRASVASRAEIHQLCLQCHAHTGSQSGTPFPPHGQLAPKVHGGGFLNWDMNQSFGNIGAGGDFVSEVDGSSFNLTFDGSVYALGYGHSVGMTNVVPPGNTVSLPTFTCTTCHDPHGISKTQFDDDLAKGDTGKPEINVFRNLIRPGPRDLTGSCSACHKYGSSGISPPLSLLAEMKSWIGGITGQYTGVQNPGANYYIPQIVNGVAVWPVYGSNDPTNVLWNTVYDGIKGNYDVSVVLDRPGSGMSSWCAKCHGAFHEENVTTNADGQDWKRHPVEYKINKDDKSGANVPTIAWDHYSTEITDGFKVPAANTDSTDLTQEHYYADKEESTNIGKGDKVFCLSCHFAHAGPYYDALRWDYTSSVSSGSQTGKSIPSNRGCQQCHDR